MAELLSRWREGLSKTSKSAFGHLAELLGTTEIKKETWEDLESIFIQADMGIETSNDVISALKAQVKSSGVTRTEELRKVLRSELRRRLINPEAFVWSSDQLGPMAILVVGVNGSGKTTTIAKLGKLFINEGKSILFGAADTFRAAGIDQLQEWGTRLNVEVIAGAPESDPGAVAFSTVQAGIARKSDIILIDTAGRLQTRTNLMEELKKVYRVVGKALNGAPHKVWLVLDATTGQNAFRQARAFKEAVKVDGVILAKLDTSAHGGMVFAIQQELKLPILFVGLGEKPEDLQPFDADAFVEGILEA
jgi:fused signal recognition particle receptor